MARNTTVKESAEVVEVEEVGGDNYAVEEVPQEAPKAKPEVRYVDDVEDVTPVTRTDNFLSGHSAHDSGGVVDLGPVTVEPEQESYVVRVTQDIESVYLGTTIQLPAMSKGNTYRVPKRVFDYLVPKGLVEGR